MKILFTPFILALFFSQQAYAQFLPFTASQAKAYQFINGALREVDLANFTYGGNLIQPINGVVNPFNRINAGGYNDTDNFIYGVQNAKNQEGGVNSGHLLRFSSNGLVQDLGLLQRGSSGVCVGDDLWFSRGGSLKRLRTLSMLTPDPNRVNTARTYSVSSRAADMGQLENNGNIFLVGIANNTNEIEIFDITDTNSVVKVQRAVLNLPVDVYGAVWTSQSGRVHCLNNGNGGIYEILDIFTNTPRAVFRYSFPAANHNDGMSSYIVDIFLNENLHSFTARQVDDCAQLKWSLSDWDMLSDITIERSFDGIKFTEIATVNKNENMFLDTKPQPGINYYRLRFNKSDQQFYYSDITVVTFSNKVDVALFPNPAAEVLNIEATVSGTVRIIDTSGKLCLTYVVSKDTENQKDISTLANGMYTIQFTATSGVVSVRKVQIQH